MTYKKYYAEGIKLLCNYVDPKVIEGTLLKLENNTGDSASCKESLSRYIRAQSMFAWFQHSDLDTFRRYAFSATKMAAMAMYENTAMHNEANVYRSYSHLYALLSNNIELIHYSSQNIHSLYGQEKGVLKRNNVNNFVYHSFNTILALRGEWSLLEKRCQYILENPTTKKRLVRYLIDHEFYLALAQGDIVEMQRCLDAITSKRIRCKEFEFGITENVISTYAVIFAKIAWLHGYQVEVKSPWVPGEWLDMTPLDQYTSDYDFLNEFELFSPWGGDYREWSPVKNKNSYRDIITGSDPYEM